MFYTFLFCFLKTTHVIGGSCHKHNFWRDKRVCHNKHVSVITHLLSRQKYACHDKVLSQQNYVCCDKKFVMTNICCNKHVFVTTKVLSRRAYFLSQHKTSFVVTNTFVVTKSMLVTKMILVAASTSDTLQEQVSQQNTVVVVLTETARYSVRLVYTGPCRHPLNMLDPAHI